MNFLLDTHVLVWWMAAVDQLSPRARDHIKDEASQLLVSAVSLYEIELKRDRDQLLYRLPRDMTRIVPMLGFRWLSIDPSDAFEAARLATDHRDPWDRMIATQAKRRDLDLITVDRALTAACVDWSVRTLW